MLEETTAPLVEAHDLVMFDLDGVVYVGGEAIDGVPEAIDRVRASGRHVAFVTNNASRRPRPRHACWSRSTVRALACCSSGERD
jgi:ribonucleotide monophosphatase NagD (HAD superfamily)